MDSLKTEKIRINKQAEVFITKTATKTLTNPSTVEKVMNFHFRDLLRAFQIYQSVELSGFGKFEISQRKLMKKLKELKAIKRVWSEQIATGTCKRDEEQIKNRLIQVEKDIEYLEARKQADETKFEGYCRRMAQSFDAASPTQGENPAD